jgi:hypothetical protein
VEKVVEVAVVAHLRCLPVPCPKGRTGIPTLAVSGIFRTRPLRESKELTPPLAAVVARVVVAELAVEALPVEALPVAALQAR